MKKVAVYMGLFLIGMASGSFLTAIAAQNASATYLKTIKMQFVDAEIRMAEAAFLSGQWTTAEFHYRNAIYFSANNNSSLLSGEWGLTMPLVFPVLEKMIAGSDPTGSGRRMQEAICRAKLAATLMQAGRDAEAAEEYEYAMKLIGESDINKVKRLAQQLSH